MKQWHTPQLIVLTRSKPEEAVLEVCKFLYVGDAPMEWFPGCAHGAEVSCTPCEAQVQS